MALKSTNAKQLYRITILKGSLEKAVYHKSGEPKAVETEAGETEASTAAAGVIGAATAGAGEPKIQET